ncbi:MAG: ABC transporter substrate-binding protein [Betaproteobacteria bacterium]|jgi:putative ABC transport system substrate-binding protein|nr:ABC transporter substrate-binding protein [Betaproteobacteria bacterium]MDH5285182.1 ABC transporter substrate-binding protein [Betaproteobacteria bacterium]
MPDRRSFLAAATSLAAGAALAQPAGGPRRIALLTAFDRSSVDALVRPLMAELDKLGWPEGRAITLLEPRFADGQYERLPAMAAELVALKPDVILVQSAPATRALMKATPTIPIVMVSVGDPVAYGIVRSLAEPGGNVTGAAFLADESARKAVALLKEMAPRIRTVAFFGRPENDGYKPMARVLNEAAPVLRVEFRFVEVSSAADFEGAFAAILRMRADALVTPPEPLITSQRMAIGRFAAENRLPLAMVGNKRLLDAGPLLTYGPARDVYPALAARYVDRILRGANPAKLPVEQPAKFELGLNEAMASTLGLTIPQSIRIQAAE